MSGNRKITDEELFKNAFKFLKEKGVKGHLLTAFREHLSNKTIADIILIGKKEILKFRNMGKKSVSQLEDLFDDFGINGNADIAPVYHGLKNRVHEHEQKDLLKSIMSEHLGLSFENEPKPFQYYVDKTKPKDNGKDLTIIMNCLASEGVDLLKLDRENGIDYLKHSIAAALAEALKKEGMGSVSISIKKINYDEYNP